MVCNQVRGTAVGSYGVTRAQWNGCRDEEVDEEVFGSS